MKFWWFRLMQRSNTGWYYVILVILVQRITLWMSAVWLQLRCLAQPQTSDTMTMSQSTVYGLNVSLVNWHVCSRLCVMCTVGLMIILMMIWRSVVCLSMRVLSKPCWAMMRTQSTLASRMSRSDYLSSSRWSGSNSRMATASGRDIDWMMGISEINIVMLFSFMSFILVVKR